LDHNLFRRLASYLLLEPIARDLGFGWTPYRP